MASPSMRLLHSATHYLTGDMKWSCFRSPSREDKGYSLVETRTGHPGQSGSARASPNSRTRFDSEPGPQWVTMHLGWLEHWQIWWFDLWAPGSSCCVWGSGA